MSAFNRIAPPDIIPPPTKINAAVAVLSKDKNSKALDGVTETPYSEFPDPAKGRLAVLAPPTKECNNLTFAGIAGDLR